jgi:molybdenum ABC transporter molybdate-binding protein
MSKSHWTDSWNVKVRVWVEQKGEAVLGEGRAELLAAINSEHSITKAAKTAGMSYRRAWSLIQEINKAAGNPLVEAAIGGKQGGGARLTAQGRLALTVYEKVRHSLVDSAVGALRKVIKSENETGDCLHLAAAISLQEAVGQILSEYALQCPSTQVRVIFGASNELADLLLAGAPGDVFLTAEPRELSRLQSAGLVADRLHRVIATNGLAAVGLPKMKRVSRVRDLMSPKVRRVALAEPACPLGNYSRRYLESVGVYKSLLPKVLSLDNSRAVLAAVVAEAADVGLAFSSDASRPGAWETLFRVPASRAAVTYEAAIVGRQRQPAAAKSLLQFLQSPTAARCLRRCGLRPAGR